MSDVIFIAATIVFFAICALYVHWCDQIIGPDDFRSTSDAIGEGHGDGAQVVASSAVGSSSGVTA